MGPSGSYPLLGLEGPQDTYSGSTWQFWTTEKHKRPDHSVGKGQLRNYGIAYHYPDLEREWYTFARELNVSLVPGTRCQMSIGRRTELTFNMLVQVYLDYPFAASNDI